MFANYDYSEFPEVKVIFKGGINNENDFLLFINQWKQLYKDKKKFTFLFDMKDISYVNPIYSYKMSSFISDLKKEPIQYLLQSKIINVNKFINFLLSIIFYIQAPVAPVYIECIDGTSYSVIP